MVLEKGDKLHVISHRFFENDVRRHFVGEVEACTDAVARIKGFTFVYDQGIGEFIKKSILRTRIISLVDGMNIINLIPRGVDIGSISYCLDQNRRLVVTDGDAFYLDINEFGPSR